jgi:hypothetical protein
VLQKERKSLWNNLRSLEHSLASLAHKVAFPAAFASLADLPCFFPRPPSCPLTEIHGLVHRKDTFRTVACELIA